MTPGTVLVDVFGPILDIEVFEPFNEIENARPMHANELALTLNEKAVLPHGTDWTSDHVYDIILEGLRDAAKRDLCLGNIEKEAISRLLKRGLTVYAVTTIPNVDIQVILKQFIEGQWGGKVRMLVKPSFAALQTKRSGNFDVWIKPFSKPLFAIVDSHWPYLPLAVRTLGLRVFISTKAFPLAAVIKSLRSGVNPPKSSVTGQGRKLRLTWPQNTTNPVEARRNRNLYKECFRQALRRMAIVLNSSRSYKLCSHYWLRQPDAFIKFAFFQGRLEAALLNLDFDSPNRNRPLPDTATYHFYPDWHFGPDLGTPMGFDARDSKYLRFRINLRVTDAFWRWSYDELIVPNWTLPEIKEGRFDDGSCLVMECASNYLLKNFWHTFVHEYIQKINQFNLHLFKGRSRNDTDFEADNVASILLVYSYGLPVIADGKIDQQDRGKIAGLFKRNACNRVFEKRAGIRREPKSFEDAEWRFCRRVAIQISQVLLESGFAVAQLRVDLRTDWKDADEAGLSVSKKSILVLTLNRLRIPTEVYLMTETPSKEDWDNGLKRKIRENSIAESRKVLDLAFLKYREHSNERGVSESARKSLSALFDYLGINLAASLEE